MQEVGSVWENRPSGSYWYLWKVDVMAFLYEMRPLIEAEIDDPPMHLLKFRNTFHVLWEALDDRHGWIKVRHAETIETIYRALADLYLELA